MDESPWSRPRLYDAMVNWEARRAREMPFYRSHFPRTGRVLDVACGTGHHAVWLRQEGWRAEGCDLSPEMLEVARLHAAEAAVEVPFFEADMEHLPADRGPYDGLLCVGNAASILPRRQALQRFFRGCRRLLADGGVLVLQILNYWPLLAQDPPRRYAPLRVGRLDGCEALFLRRFDFSALPVEGLRRGYVQQITMWREDGDWRMSLHEGGMTPWLQSDLEHAADGFRRMEWYGEHAGSAFDVVRSTDLILVAQVG